MAAGLVEAFEERQLEVATYIDFLQAIEDQARRGPPRLAGAEHPISVQQQKILYSSVYLQLYNLVESTITRCVEAVASAATENGAWQVNDLTESLRSEWVRGMARTHVELNIENRFKAALELCNHLIESRPITKLIIEKGGGGNWDDTEIENISKRIGFTLRVNEPVYREAKRQIKDGLGSLGVVKRLRNDLAHGSISFTECGDEVTVSELRILKDNTVNYLREVVEKFVLYLERFEYIVPERRPN